MTTAIKPSVGRVVLISRPTDVMDPRQPECGLVTYVFDQGTYINVAGFDQTGRSFQLNSLLLVQPGEPKPEGEPYAFWMDYQKGQAAKAEALQAQIDQANAPIQPSSAK